MEQNTNTNTNTTSSTVEGNTVINRVLKVGKSTYKWTRRGFAVVGNV